MAQENENLKNTINNNEDTGLSREEKIDALIDIAFGYIEYSDGTRKYLNTTITKTGLMSDYIRMGEEGTREYLNDLSDAEIDILFNKLNCSITEINYQKAIEERTHDERFEIIAESANPTFGTVEMNPYNDDNMYRENSTITLTAVPNTTDPNKHYIFTEWNDENTDNPRTITVKQQAEYTASFEEVYTVTVNSNNNDWGTASIDPEQEYYKENETVTLTAAAKGGYEFVKWNDENTDNPRTITVTEDATYTANFTGDLLKIITYLGNPNEGAASISDEVGSFTITVNDKTISADQFTKTATGTYELTLPKNAGEISLTPEPAAGYEFSVLLDSTDSEVDSHAPVLFNLADYESYLQYGFKLCFTETSQENDNLKTISWQNSELMAITATINGVECTNGGSYPVGSEVTMTATPITNSKFDSWKDLNNNGAVISTNNPYIFILNDNVNIRVEASLNLLG